MSRVDELRELEARQVDEDDWLDYKVDQDPSRWWELAKDIAGLANRFGGELIIGVDHNADSRAVKIGGLPAARVQAVLGLLDEVKKVNLRPCPIVTTDTLTLATDSQVLVVHVEAYIFGLVGAMYYKLNQRSVPGTSNAWQFPLRNGQHTMSLSPDDFALYLDPKIRRTVVLLENLSASLDEEQGVRAEIFGPNFASGAQPRTIRHVKVNARNNTVDFIYCELDGITTQPLSIPVDSVVTVYRRRSNIWRLDIEGYFKSEGSEIVYVNRNV